MASPHPITAVKSAIHKSVAGAGGQAAPEAAVSVGGGPTAVAEDLAVMAQQAAAYSAGASAGNAMMESNRGTQAAGIARQRAQQEEERQSALEQQRLEMQAIEQKRRLAQQQAALEREKMQSDMSLDRQFAEESILQNRMRRQLAEEEQRERDEDERDKEILEAQGRAGARVLVDLQKRGNPQEVSAFTRIIDSTDNLSDALSVLHNMDRKGLLKRGGAFEDAVNYWAVHDQINKYYTALAKAGAKTRKGS